MNEPNQKDAELAERQPVPTLWSLAVICTLSWTVPGLGHLLLKQTKKGILFFICILFLFFWGLNLGAKIYQYEPHQPLTFFAVIAQLGTGLPYFFVKIISFYAHSHTDFFLYGFAEKFQFGSGALESLTYEYGNTFVIVAGLLNFLVILDAYDIATGKKKG